MNSSKHIVAMLCAACALPNVMAESIQRSAGVSETHTPTMVTTEEIESNAVSFEISLDVCSKQLTYGLVDNADPIATLGVSTAWHGFTFEAAAILDTTRWGAKHGEYGNRKLTYQEFAFGPGYGYAFSPEEWSLLPTTVEISGNYIYEYHPHVNKMRYSDGEDTNPDTQFLNLALVLPDVPLSPSIAYELDLDNEVGAMYVSAAIEHTMTLLGSDDAPTLELGLGAALGFGNARRNAYDAEKHTCGFKDISATLTLAWHATDWLTLAPYVTVSEQIGSSALRNAAKASNQDRSSCIIYAGIAATASF